MQFNYRCSDCGQPYTIDPQLTVCPICREQQAPDQPLRGVLEVKLCGNTDKDFDVFDLLPVPRRYFPPIPVGNTPLWRPENLRRSLGFENLYIKDDGLNPTCSLKDRASFLVSAFAARHGIKEIVLASTGNAGSSMAGVGAAAGQKVTLFLPATAPEAKLIQALQYGATVHRVKGPYDQAYDLSLEYSNRSDALYRAFHTGKFEVRPSQTVADSICVDIPRNGRHALKQLQAHNGRIISVSDGEIIAAQARLSGTAGLFSEPAGAAAFAGFLKIMAELPRAAEIVILATGNGLKDSTSAGRGITVPAETIQSLSDITKGN